LSVAGDEVDREQAYDWASAFAVADGGEGTLRFPTSPLRFVALALQFVLWVAALIFLWRHRPAARPADAAVR
jgi:hypothetical protein